VDRDRIATFSTGTKLVLAAGGLLFVDLFLTWQATELDFGPNLQVTKGLDAWDFWGLLIGLLTLALLAIVIIRESDAEVLLDSRWDVVPLVLGGLVFVIAVVKNLRDSDSTWASYLGVALAAAMAVGAFLDWTRTRSDDIPVHSAWQPQPAGMSQGSAGPSERSSDEPDLKW
jgi:hypothetical protein